MGRPPAPLPRDRTFGSVCPSPGASEGSRSHLARRAGSARAKRAASPAPLPPHQETPFSSTRNASSEFGGIDVPEPAVPYASDDGMSSSRTPPTFIPGIASTHP